MATLPRLAGHGRFLLNASKNPDPGLSLDTPDLIRRIYDDTAFYTGVAFFEKITRNLAQVTGADFTFVGELFRGHSVRTLALCDRDLKMLPELIYELADTPCNQVIGHEACVFPRKVQQAFPKDDLLKQMGIQAYMGIPLADSRERPSGILVCLFQRELPSHENTKEVLKLFSVRIGSELERVRFERELEEARHEAESAHRLKNAFLANMSHEIRTPLNSMLGYGDLLAQGDLTPEERETFAEHLRAGGQSLLRLVDNILLMSRLGSQNAQIHRELIHPVALLEEISTAYHPRFSKKNLKFQNELPRPAENPGLETDRDFLRHALEQLLDNSLKFTEQGEVCLRARYQSKPVAGWEIEIQDSGPGIPEDFKKHLFEPFTQARDDLDRPAPGAGLGLAITKAICDLLGGSLRLTNAPEGGCRARLWLPIG